MLEGSVCMQNRKTAAFSIKNNKKHRETSGQNWAKIGILLLLTITQSLTHSLTHPRNIHAVASPPIS